ncbi:unnamed protein product [Allacma fusca]|uniref:Phosphodiesterase n=1 Tax=Allacma fusca TaxID=39272 RepID=A0A8J2PA99_9HEXA|nr:unnamed protein product [Allacma fusca]
MSHERIFRCQSATFEIDGATYQIVANEQEPTNGLKILRKKNIPVDLNSDLTTLSTSAVTQRLKLILDKLESGQQEEVSREVLRKNIQYAIELLQEGESANRALEDKENESDTQVEAISEPIDENTPPVRQGAESENELSEVDEEVIPEEVRQWLAATFTRNMPSKPKTEPRPRFRSVANAIRVGLFVDRFYRQLSSNSLQIPTEVAHILKEINNWHFDIFKLHEKSNNHSLKYVAKDLFSRYGVVQKFRIDLEKLDNFLAAVEYGYTKLKNPYHNDVHAADVTQTLHFFISSSGVANVFTDLEIFSLLFAALIHDFEHTGRTNNFHVNVGTDLSLIYNDRSVLENHHVSAAFRLLREEDKNILGHLKPEEHREFRNLVIEMVLSTDMSSHFTQIKNVKAYLNGERHSHIHATTMAMSLMLHSADISHPGKPWKIHKKLADLIIEEFFLQGDEESRLGLPFSPLCDRNNVLVPESQISFIEFIVEPTLSILSDLMTFMVNGDNEGSWTSSGQTKDSSNPHGLKQQSSPINSNKHLVTRRAESDNSLKSDGKTAVNSRTSFPLQSGKPPHGPIVKPWVNHLLENKSKWRMISAGKDLIEFCENDEDEEAPEHDQ